MAKSQHNIPPKDPNRINDMVKGGKRYGPKPAQQRYQSVDEINAIYNMFLQNYERSRMEGQRAENAQWHNQYINRGWRAPIEQPVAPQFRYPTAPGRGGGLAPQYPPGISVPRPMPMPMPRQQPMPMPMPMPKQHQPSINPPPMQPPMPMPKQHQPSTNTKPIPMPKHQQPSPAMPPYSGETRPMPPRTFKPDKPPTPKMEKAAPSLNSFIPRYERPKVKGR